METNYVPLEFWYSSNAGLALPFLVAPDPSTGIMMYYDTMQGEHWPLADLLAEYERL